MIPDSQKAKFHASIIGNGRFMPLDSADINDYTLAIVVLKELSGPPLPPSWPGGFDPVKSLARLIIGLAIT
jgi:hypothetical protein